MKKLILLAAIGLAACGPEPDTMMNVAMPAKNTGRIVVTRIGVIKDELAYQEKRGIYIIKDTETSEEFIGVSGVGITEIGSHACGKACARQDER